MTMSNIKYENIKNTIDDYISKAIKDLVDNIILYKSIIEVKDNKFGIVDDLKFNELLDKLRKSCDLYSDILTTDKRIIILIYLSKFVLKKLKKNEILNLNAKNQSTINNKANNNIENINNKVVYNEKNTSKQGDVSIYSKMAINPEKKNRKFETKFEN